MTHTPYAFLDFLIPLYDPYGDHHAAGVSEWSGMLASAAGLLPSDIQHIELAAKYHDLGKIAIPETIRRYVGVYTAIERYTMEKHPQVGAQLVQLLDFDPQIVATILGHHENFDGSGYPSMLRREQIPIGARVIRIADSFDALTHSRGYRQAFSNRKALQRMNDDRRFYDPDLLSLFGEMVNTWTQQVP